LSTRWDSIRSTEVVSMTPGVSSRVARRTARIWMHKGFEMLSLK